ncbi:MAG TPA: TonB-dependent receptor [Burkholderiales bacterium]|nr:TonB-dependent receptor [Burkholderiales bacterium]
MRILPVAIAASTPPAAIPPSGPSLAGRARAFLCLALGAPLLAVAAEAEPGTVVAPTVTVTATRSDLGSAEQPIAASVVTHDEIRQTPAQSLDDALRTVTGLNVQDNASYQTHPTANAVSMRGLGGTRALVLRDGVPLNDPFFGYVQWNRVPMETVDRVEVLRGGASSLWGNFAMGGVVNIFSREPDANTAELSGGYGSQNTRRANGYGAWAPSDRFGLSANLNDWRTDGYNQVPEDQRAPLDVPTSFSAQNVELTGKGRLTDSTTAFARFGYHENDQTLGTPLSTNHQRNADYSGGITQRLPDDSRLSVTAFYTDEHFVTANTGTPTGFSRGFAEYVQNLHDTPVEDVGLSGVWSKRVNDLVPLVSAGADLRHIRGEDSSQIFDETGAHIRTDVGRGSQRFVGVFAQVEVDPIERLQLVAALRQERWTNYDGFDGNPGGIGETPDQSASSTSPRLSARYAVTDNFALRGAAYKAFRAPTLDNLYRAYAIPGGIFQPNAALTPERLTGGEAGFDIDYSRVHGQVTYYEDTIRDLITSRNLDPSELPAGFFFGTRNINAGKARTRGIEAEFSWQFAPAWSALFSYAYVDAKILENDADPATVGHTQGGIPRQQGSVGLGYEPGNGFKASTRVRSAQAYYADNAGTLPVGSHTVVDVYAAYAFSKRVEVFGQVQNLFDQTYIAQNSGNATPYLGQPFTAFAGVRLKAF